MKNKLTPREQEIFDMLLKNTPPKRIALNLNIAYNTLLFYKKNLYRKLKVHSVNELILKYSRGADEGFPGVFLDWRTNKDDKGSFIDDVIIKTDDVIDGEFVTSYNLSGFRTPKDWAWACANGTPSHSSTLKAMKTMGSFSLKVLGDGGFYAIMLNTIDTNGDDNYCIMFPTTKNKISTITVNVDDLAQWGYGTPAPFHKENIVLFEVHPLSPGPFHLKFWDIRFHKQKLPTCFL